MAISTGQTYSAIWLVLSYSPITPPATEKQMNRITVRAIIFKLMKRAVLSFMILYLQFGRVVVSTKLV